MNDIYSILLLAWADKSAASTLLVASEIGLLVASIIVVIGVAGENRMDKEAAKWSPAPPWIKHWHSAFAICVVIGVGGELLSDGGVFAASHRLQFLQESELVEVRKLTADRSLTAEEQKSLTKALSAFPGQPAKIIVFPVTFEGTWIAGQIYGAMLNAHWKVDFPERPLSRLLKKENRTRFDS